CSRIPYYRLPQVLRDHPQLSAVGRLTLFQSLRCLRKALWDEGRHKLVSFREMESVPSPASRAASGSRPIT
ncbi:MAG: fatty acid desaturase, partial [Rhodoplanes sp.]